MAKQRQRTSLTEDADADAQDDFHVPLVIHSDDDDEQDNAGGETGTLEDRQTSAPSTSETVVGRSTSEGPQVSPPTSWTEPIDEQRTPIFMFLTAKQQHVATSSRWHLTRRGQSTDKQKAPPIQPPSSSSSSLLPYPLQSLSQLHGYLRLHANDMCTKRRQAFPEFLQDPPCVRIILRGVGYLGHAPLLRTVIMHHVLVDGFGAPSEAHDQSSSSTTTEAPPTPSSGRQAAVFELALAVLDMLRRDVSQVYIRLESLLRETFFDVAKNTSSQAIIRHSISTVAFTVALRRDVIKMVDTLKREGPRPALVIVPSAIGVANFGLYLRGSVKANSRLMGYGGEEEDADAHGSGYRMMVTTKLVVDAKYERCLCSMMNDARGSPFANNVRFTSARSGVRSVTTKAVADEELFVGYGTLFRFDLEDTAAGFSRALAADFVVTAKGCHLPRLAQNVNAMHLRFSQERTRVVQRARRLREEREGSDDSNDDK